MKYKAVVDSFEGGRKPAFCASGRIYDFDTDPGKHFKCIEKPPVDREKEDIIREAEELGLDVDKRKSAKTLAAEVERAKTVEEDGKQ